VEFEERTFQTDSLTISWTDTPESRSLATILSVIRLLLLLLVLLLLWSSLLRDLFSHPATPPYLVAIRQRGDALNRKVEAFFRKHGTKKGLPADILDERADDASEVNAALVKLGGTPRQLPPPSFFCRLRLG